MNEYDKQSNNVGFNNVVSIDTTTFDSLARALYPANKNMTGITYLAVFKPLLFSYRYLLHAIHSISDRKLMMLLSF